MNPREPSVDEDTAEPKGGFVHGLRHRMSRAWFLISGRFFVITFILLIGFVVWGIATWLPPPMKPLAGTVLGWVLGLLSVPFVEAVKNTRDIQQLARLLKMEVTFNSKVLRDLKFSLESYAKLSGLPTDSKGIPTVQPPPPNQFRFTVFNTTLSKHGLLPAFTVLALHDFYWHLTQIETFRQAWEDQKSDPFTVHDLLRLMVEEATAALKIGSPSRLIAALRYQGELGLFQRIFRLSP